MDVEGTITNFEIEDKLVRETCAHDILYVN